MKFKKNKYNIYHVNTNKSRKKIKIKRREKNNKKIENVHI
jgi:hypothetical protein